MTASTMDDMKTPSFADTQTDPLDTDADITLRVRQLIGRANQRQIWLLFLDHQHVQLPLVIPIDGLPLSPSDADVAIVLEHVGEVMAEIGAEAIVTVIERYASPRLTSRDLEWATAIRVGCVNAGISLRAQLLSHRTGVRFIAERELG
jgi:hypothetical protein